MANRLAHEVLGRSLDELPPQTRRAACAPAPVMVARRCERQGLDAVPSSASPGGRRASVIGLGQRSFGVHLARLIELEYVLVHRGGRGQSFVYELLFDGKPDEQGPRLSGLIGVEKLGNVLRQASVRGKGAGFKGPIRGQNGGSKVGLRSPETLPTFCAATSSGDTSHETAKSHVLESSLTSYRSSTSYTNGASRAEFLL